MAKTDDQKPDEQKTPPPTAAAAREDAPQDVPAEHIGEVVPATFFQAFEAPEPITFAKVYRYVGPGTLAVVPAEDLSEAVVRRLPSDIHREVAASPFYEAVEGGK